MRKLSLKTYSLYSLKKINNSDSFKVKEMLKNVESNNTRLYAPLLCWVYLNNIKVDSSSILSNDLLSLNMQANDDENLLLIYLKNSSNKELNKYYRSYISENMRRDEDELKNKYRVEILKLKDEKHYSEYKLCHLVHINSGNLSQFLNHNINNKLSLNKCKQLFELLALN